jgi:hypothetical protein
MFDQEFDFENRIGDRLVTSSYSPEDSESEPTLRPKSIDEYIGQEKAKENLLCDITSATSKAIIEEVIAEEGLITPKIISVKGTHKGRVIVRFETGEELNCAQNYLRSQLIRRFKPGFRRKR